jgi:xylose isomerase
MSLTKYLKRIPQIRYEGPDSDNPFCYRWYDPTAEIAGRTMRDWLRFSVAWWHSFRGTAADMFGPGTIHRPWEQGDPESLSSALRRAEVAFDFITKFEGLDYYCFHDRDIAPEGATVARTNQNLWRVARHLKQLQKATGIKLLWGTANLFSHPRFSQGASTSSNADIFAYCANSVKEALEVTKYLNGENYVFWGGREGYNSLLNTDLAREERHLAAFLRMAVDHAQRIGFTGQFLIEPKPCEPSKHQYDTDAHTVLGFLARHRLAKHFKLNIEANHATLAGHDFVHELEVSRVNGALGSVDANRGDLMNGWDTDQFPIDFRETAMAMLVIMKNGGLGSGGLNFDAKVRRDSYDVEDLVHGHLSGIDAFARGLRIAARIIADGRLDGFVRERYASWDDGIGREIERGRADFRSLQRYILRRGRPAPLRSARQEYLENLFNSFC